MSTIFASGLIEKSFRAINKEFGKKAENNLRHIIKANKKTSQFQELNSFLVIMSQTKHDITPKRILEIEKKSFFELFKNYNDRNIEKFLTKRLKNDKELKETSEIVLDFLNEIETDNTDTSYKETFTKKVTKLYQDLPEMLNEISIRTFMALWDLDEQNKYRFYLNGFDHPDQMLFEIDKSKLYSEFNLLEHFDEFIILNFFLAFTERTLYKLNDLQTILNHLQFTLPKVLIYSSNNKVQIKVNLFFRIITAKLSALQELDNLMVRIFDLFTGSEKILRPLNLISVNNIGLNNILDLIGADVQKGRTFLHSISQAIINCQRLLRSYSEEGEEGEEEEDKTEKIIINDISEFNSLMKSVGDLSIDLFIESEILKFWGDFFGQDLPNFNFNTDIFSLNDESVLKSSQNAIITVNGLFKNYNLGSTTVYALRGLNFEIFTGEFVIIFGSSGAGKTTLLNCMATLDTPDRGIVLFKGENINKMSDNEKSKLRLREMGFIFQNYALLPHYNAKENVTLPAELAGLSRKLRDRITDLLKGVEIDMQAKQFPAQLSGGQMQRVSIARALTNNPTVIFADEPTGDLDSVTGTKVMDLLALFHRETNTTVVVITHDESLLRYATRVMSIKDGLLIDDRRVR